MEEIYGNVMELMKKPAIVETFVDILLCAVPIWVAVMIGLVIGWSWRPRWTGLVYLGLRSRFRFCWTAPPGFGARRLWFAFTALSAFSVARRIWSNFKGKDEPQVRSNAGSNATSAAPVAAAGAGLNESMERIGSSESLSMESPMGQHDIVTEKDLEHLLYLLEGKTGDLAWQHMMERSTPTMAYQAWRHEPQMGSPIYRSRTVYEDATPELLRDFFWDDEFRPKWDPMLSYFKILEECPHTGTMIVHWIKKFPFFCSDREYIIGRRIWESGKTYYCVTKTVPYPSLSKRDKPRRVEQYFSSWAIRAVESRKRDGQMSACEVTLVHYEDMGIPKDVANIGVRHGMWGTVKKIHSGVRAYQQARKSDAPLSRSALLAAITTKIPINESNESREPLAEVEDGSSDDDSVRVANVDNENGVDWRWVAVGGTVALVCGLHTGLIGKALLVGVGRRVMMRK